MQAPAMREERAREILTQYCNPKTYGDDQAMIAALAKDLPREILASLRTFLGNLIDNDNMSGPEKVKKYFNLSISDESRAEDFIDDLYCNISEHLFPEEE